VDKEDHDQTGQQVSESLRNSLSHLYPLDDMVNIADKNIDISTIKEQLISLYTMKDKKNYLLACNYCGGRDFTTPLIKAAVQTKSPIAF